MESIEPHSPIDIDEEEDYDVKPDDKFQDPGELDLGAAQDNLFLTRMPKFTWEALASLKDDDEVQVGTLRLEGDKQNPNRASLLLRSEISAFRLVPREYNMRVMNKSSSNTFVFTEKDLPGYKRKAAGQGVAQAAQPQGVEKKEGQARRHFRMPGYRRAIPKKTALTGHVQSEFNCLPVENQDYVNILTRRQVELPKAELAPELVKDKVAMLKLLNPQGMKAADAFAGFIRTAPPKEKKQQQKYARIPKNELLDKLFGLFAEFKYYNMASLRVHTEQPESYLRETLEEIATLIKSGPYANTWKLKEDTRIDPATAQGVKHEVAPMATGMDGASEDDDDDYENIKMEDV